MIKKYLILFLLIVLTVSCNSPVEQPDYKDYFPLAIGNKWYYTASVGDSGEVNFIWEIVSQEKINSKNYFKMIKQDLNNQYFDTTYYRFNNDTLFYKIKNHPEQIIADFSLGVNNTAYWQYDLKVTEKSNDLIKFETPFGADYGFSTTYKKGIGMTESIANGFIYYYKKLVKAEIK